MQSVSRILGTCWAGKYYVMDACTGKERINERAATLENGVMGLIATSIKLLT